MRLVNGVLAAGATLGILAAGMGTIHFAARTWAARRLAANASDLNAEAVLLLF